MKFNAVELTEEAITPNLELAKNIIKEKYLVKNECIVTQEGIRINELALMMQEYSSVTGKGAIDVDTEILRLLSEGLTQKEVSENFKKRGIKPNSNSSIDSRISNIKIDLDCKTIAQLMYKIGLSNSLNKKQ